MAEEKTRPKPTKDIIAAMCGRDNYLLNCLHHGLRESPLASVYPLLDIEELAAFSAGSWMMRDREPEQVMPLTQTGIYNLFSGVYKKGYPLLNNHKDISQFSQEQLTRYRELNPFSGRDLEARLAQANPSDYLGLTQNLTQPTRIYVFEGQYDTKKRELGGDNSRLAILNFQNTFPPGRVERVGQQKHDKQYARMIDAFAMEISRIIGTYPSTYLVPDSQKPEAPEVSQPKLF